MADGPKIVYANAPTKIQNSIIKESDAVKLSDKELKNSKGNGGVISRSTPILVQRDPNGQADPRMLAAAELSTDGTAVSNRRIDNGEVRIYRAPPKPKDAPSTARLAPPAPTPPEESEVAPAPVVAAAPAPVAAPVAHGTEVPRQEPAPVGTVVHMAPVARSKTKVQFSGAGMGKVTLPFHEVHLSESLIVLAYPNDGETEVELPQSSTDDPLQVLIGGVQYPCMSGGFAFIRENMTFLVLVRLDR